MLLCVPGQQRTAGAYRAAALSSCSREEPYTSSSPASSSRSSKSLSCASAEAAPACSPAASHLLPSGVDYHVFEPASISCRMDKSPLPSSARWMKKSGP